MSVKKAGSILLSTLSLAAFIGGCSSSSKEGGTNPADVPKVSEGLCFTCHSTSIDHIAGTKIVEEYLKTKHYLNNFNQVGCQDCHGGGAQHNGVGPIPYPNPDTAYKCYDCHQNYLKYVYGHFFDYSAVNRTGHGNQAVIVSKNYQNSCTSCHDPHMAENAVGRFHEEWAGSGHGDVTSLAWSEEDFKNNKGRGTTPNYACIRCHTATGYINYVTSNFANAFPTTTWATADDPTREVLTCKACHTDYNFKNRVREVGQFTAPYNSGKSPVLFPDVGTSNLCIPCHSARESGDSINAVTDFTNAKFVNSHYFGAAAMLFSKSGFRYYTSSAKYSYTREHPILGTAADPGTGSTTLGPCVTCHIGQVGNATHSFDPVIVAGNTTTSSGGSTYGCYGCHGDPLEDPPIDELIEEQRAYFERFFDFFVWQMEQSGIYTSSEYPYFFSDAGMTTQITNWTYAAGIGPATGTGAKNMGAAFNYKFASAEGGVHVHNRTFAKRLITDSIQYLQTGTNTYSFSESSSGPNYNGQADPNNIVNFSNYSAAVPTFTASTGASVSISTLKSELLRLRSGLWYRR